MFFLFFLNFDLLSSSNNTWEPVDHLKCQDLIQAFEEKIQNQGKRYSYKELIKPTFLIDPEEEFEVEEVCGKKRIDGDLYYFVKWKGYPE